MDGDSPGKQHRCSVMHFSSKGRKAAVKEFSNQRVKENDDDKPVRHPFVQAKSFTKGRIKSVQLIVLHSEEAPKTEGRTRNVVHFFQTAPASAHFCVDDKEVIQCVRPEDTAFQCKKANGIGIEHSG